MLEFQCDTKIVIDEFLVQYHIFSTDAPLMITFAPAGYVLTQSEVEKGQSAWGFDFFKKMGVNIISFAPIKNKHWYLSTALLEYIDELSPDLAVFPERLGYGASMGAFAHTLYYAQLQLNRLLLFTPLTPPKGLKIPDGFDFCAGFDGEITLIYDPLCQNDKDHALSYPSTTNYLNLYGVGHQVIETISKIGYLKPLILEFLENDVNRPAFYLAMRKRRNVERYYSYMARNPTGKATFRRRNIIRFHFFIWHFKHPTYFIEKLSKKWRKSIKKRLN